MVVRPSEISACKHPYVHCIYIQVCTRSLIPLIHQRESLTVPQQPLYPPLHLVCNTHVWVTTTTTTTTITAATPTTSVSSPSNIYQPFLPQICVSPPLLDISFSLSCVLVCCVLFWILTTHLLLLVFGSVTWLFVPFTCIFLPYSCHTRYRWLRTRMAL